MKSSLEKTIEKKYGKIIHRFPVCNIAWEMDNVGFVVRDKNDKKHIILTNHNSPYFSCEKELKLKIEEYKGLINETEKTISFFKE